MASYFSREKSMSIFVTSVNPKIVNTKESTKKCEGGTQAENNHLKITAIVVRLTEANIRTQRVRDHT